MMLSEVRQTQKGQKFYVLPHLWKLDPYDEPTHNTYMILYVLKDEILNLFSTK
jgi:hypothetical protein